MTAVTEAAAPAYAVRRVLVDDGVELHVEVTGRGPDLLFLHEFSGDHRSWEPQVRALSRHYRCITFSARGYTPSSVPADPDAYSQAQAVRDAMAVLDATGSERAHVVGISMGGFTAIHLALDHPSRVSSVVAAACGYGADVERETFAREMAEMASVIREKGCAHLAELTANSPYRLAFAAKDPRGFDEWRRGLAQHDRIGASNTMLRVQGERPTLRALMERFDDLKAPLMLIVGDEDEPCLDIALAAKRRSPTVALAILPRTAHTVNLEEPEAFNRHLVSHFASVDGRSWFPRDARSMTAGGGWVR